MLDFRFKFNGYPMLQTISTKQGILTFVHDDDNISINDTFISAIDGKTCVIDEIIESRPAKGNHPVPGTFFKIKFSVLV